MTNQTEVNELADITAVSNAALAKLIGYLFREIAEMDPAARLRIKARLYEVGMHPDVEKREITTGIVKQVARSAGMRLTQL